MVARMNWLPILVQYSRHHSKNTLGIAMRTLSSGQSKIQFRVTEEP